MRVIILAAGYGTRLYPLTINLPKPLIEVNGMPIINFLTNKIKLLRKSFGIQELLIVSNNKFYNHFNAWNKKYRVGAAIINDGTNTPDDRLGAVRDIRYAIGKTIDDWLILGGDNLFEDDLRNFLSAAHAIKPRVSIGAYDIKNKLKACNYGVVKLDSAGYITDFKEKPKHPNSTLAASCVYFFPQNSLDLLDIFIREHDNYDASGTYIQWLIKHDKVRAHILRGYWFDIGCLKSLKQAEKELRKKN